MVRSHCEGPGFDLSDRVRWVDVGSHEEQPPPVPAPEQPGTVTVAGKPGIDIPPGTLNSVLKQARLKK
jgi:predicted RNA binding protein YcfA (HicA-like mRNA interferase family)